MNELYYVPRNKVIARCVIATAISMPTTMRTAQVSFKFGKFPGPAFNNRWQS